MSIRQPSSVAGNQPDAYGIAPGHEPVAVVPDLVNPVGAGRGLVGGGWQARIYEGGSTQHAEYLGSLPFPSEWRWNESGAWYPSYHHRTHDFHHCFGSLLIPSQAPVWLISHISPKYLKALIN
jgi:hypothetical protein